MPAPHIPSDLEIHALLMELHTVIPDRDMEAFGLPFYNEKWVKLANKVVREWVKDYCGVDDEPA